MEKELIVKLRKNFEDCAHEADGVQFWYARELQVLLGYDQWRNFEHTIQKAKIACENAKQAMKDHFADVSKMIQIGKGATKEISDILLTRYACYLIAQNGDSRKDEVAFAMSYFAIQTRKQELIEQRLADWERLHAREKLSLTEKELSRIMYDHGIDNQGFARIRSKGDQALFGGYSTANMKNKLGVPSNRPLADFLPAVTIKAKDLASEITSYNLKKDRSFSDEPHITKEHEKNNKNVRETLTKSGIHPESLPAEEDVKKVERKLKTEDKKLPKTVHKLKEK